MTARVMGRGRIPALDLHGEGAHMCTAHFHVRSGCLTEECYRTSIIGIPLRSRGRSRGCALLNVRCEVGTGEDQSARHLAAPRLDATLQGPELAVGEPSCMVGL